MSDTEHHKGKLIELIGENGEKGKDLIEVLVSNDKDYYSDNIEFFRNEMFETHYYHEKTDTVYLIRNTKLDPYADVIEGFENSEGDIEYVATFYNGGASLNCCLEEIINKLNEC